MKRSINSQDNVSDDDFEPPHSLVQPLLDLTSIVRNFIELIGKNVNYQQSLQTRQDAQVKEMQFEMTSGERELRKRLDIVYRVFKQASTRLTRIDRNWQEVIDSQVYIIDELRNETDSADCMPGKSRKDKSHQSPLEQSITDFQFTLNKAIDDTVEQGVNKKGRYAPSSPVVDESAVP